MSKEGTKYTRTEDLSEAVQAKYELTEPLEGGPVFGMPAYGHSRIDFSTMGLPVATALVQAGFPYLRLKPKKTETPPAKSGKTDPL